MDLTSVEIDITPAQATQFAEPHACEYCSDNEWPPTSCGIFNEGVQLGHRREVNAGP
jgi:hypothetical protein